MARVVATLLTRNRVELLRKAVRAVLEQQTPVDEVIVVDNASDDGTPEVLAAEFPQVRVVALPENQGATGGFYEAIAAGLRTGADWLWLLDDDCFARPDALTQLLEALRRLDGGPAPAVLSSRVEWRDGNPHPMNLPVIRPDDGQELAEALHHGLLPIRAASWVSLFLSREAVERAGMPLRQFFYQADDIEYTARILRDARGYYVPRSVVEHSTPTKHTAVDDDHRFHYHVRNTLLMIRGRAWERREKTGLWSVLLWTSLRYLRKNRRRPLAAVRTLAAGIADGLRTPAG
jgi:rhamnopyranosyl-N-acetylglucosaminyl-diphospho-decaprenol beta-1,3/1,4-galactofuranosyltransferase